MSNDPHVQPLSENKQHSIRTTTLLSASIFQHHISHSR